MQLPIDPPSAHAGISWLISILSALPSGALAGGLTSWLLARKKARSDAIQNVRDVRADLLSEVNCYWLSESRDSALEKTITRHQMKFDVKLRDLFLKYGKESERAKFARELTHLNTMLTAAPFGTTEFRQSPHRVAAARQRIDDLMKDFIP